MCARVVCVQEEFSVDRALIITTRKKAVANEPAAAFFILKIINSKFKLNNHEIQHFVRHKNPLYHSFTLQS